MKSIPGKRVIAAVMAIVVLTIAAIGVSTVVQAQTAPTTPASNAQQTQRDKFVTALASRLHIGVDQLKQAITDARTDVGEPNTANGAKPNGRGFGFGGRGGFMGKELDAVAVVFHETTDALKAELPNKTLAELAAAHKVSNQDVINAIVTTANQQVDQTASTRGLTADRVSQIKQQISERAQQFVTTHRFPAPGSGTRS